MYSLRLHKSEIHLRINILGIYKIQNMPDEELIQYANRSFNMNTGMTASVEVKLDKLKLLSSSYLLLIMLKRALNYRNSVSLIGKDIKWKKLINST